MLHVSNLTRNVKADHLKVGPVGCWLYAVRVTSSTLRCAAMNGLGSRVDSAWMPLCCGVFVASDVPYVPYPLALET